MFIRVYTVKHIGIYTYQTDGELVINTSQIASINEITGFPSMNNKKKYENIFDTKDLSVFQIKLSNGDDFLIIGSTQKFKNIK